MDQSELTGRRVLVVEDDYFIAHDIAEALAATGASVIGPVANGENAMAALTQAPELATLDVRLGDETSKPIAKELERRGIPFIYATGSWRHLPAEHGAHEVFRKPGSYSHLIDLLARALEAAVSPER